MTRPSSSSDRSRAFATDVALQLSGRASNLVLALFSSLLLARTLGNEDFGRWATIFAIVQVMGYLGDVGLQQVAVRRAVTDATQESEVLGALLSLRAALSLPVAALCAGLTAVVATNPEMRLVGLIASFTPLLAGLTATTAIFQLRLRNYLPVFLTSLNNLIWAAVVVLASLGVFSGMPLLAAGYVAAAAFAACVQFALAIRLAPVTFAQWRVYWRELFWAGLPIGISSVVAMAYGKFDQVLVFTLAGSDAAGLYAATYRIYEQVQFIPASIVLTVYPALAAAYYRSDRSDLVRITQTTAEFLLFVSLPTIAFSMVAAEPLITLLFGPAYSAAAPALLPLAVSFLLVSIGWLTGHLLFAAGFEKRFLIYTLIGLVVNVTFNLLLIPRYGFVAAAVITAVTDGLVMLLSVFTLPFARAFFPPLDRVGRIAAAAMVMGLTVWALRRLDTNAALLLLSAAATYLAVASATGALEGRRLYELVRRTSTR